MAKIEIGKVIGKGVCESEGHAEIQGEYGATDIKVYDCLLTSPSGPQSALKMCEACIGVSELCGFELIDSELELVK